MSHLKDSNLHRGNTAQGYWDIFLAQSGMQGGMLLGLIEEIIDIMILPSIFLSSQLSQNHKSIE